MQLLNLVRFTTSTTGTNNIAVGSAVSGFSTPAQAGTANGVRVPYVIVDGSNKAFGIGTYSTTGPSLTRDANEISISSGARTTAKLSLSGSAEVYFDGAERLLMHRPDIVLATSSSSFAPNADQFQGYRLTAQATDITINAPGGTPYDGQLLTLEFVDDGVSRAITWNAAFVSNRMYALPSSTGGATTLSLTVVFEYNATRAQWLCLSIRREPNYFRDIEYVGGTSGTAAGGVNLSVSLTSLTGGIAAAPIEGDLVIVDLAQGSVTSSDIPDSFYGSKWAELNVSGTTSLSVARFAKFMTSTPDTALPTFNNNLATDAQGIIVRVYRNVDPTTPLDVAVQTATGNSQPINHADAISAATAGAVVVVGGVSAAASASTFTAPADLTNFVTVAQNDTVDIALGVGHSFGRFGSAFSPASWPASADSWASIISVLRPRKYTEAEAVAAGLIPQMVTGDAQHIMARDKTTPGAAYPISIDEARKFLRSYDGVQSELALAADETSNVTTVALIADANGNWQVPVEAGKNYRIVMKGQYQTAAGTTGVKLGLYAGSGAAGILAGNLYTQTTASAYLSAALTLGTDLVTTGVDSANTNRLVQFDVTFYCAVSGTIDVRWGSEVSGSTVRLQSGSRLIWREMFP